jgi:hypothetical protein
LFGDGAGVEAGFNAGAGAGAGEIIFLTAFIILVKKPIKFFPPIQQ